MGWHEQGDGNWFLGVNVVQGRVKDYVGVTPAASTQYKKAFRQVSEPCVSLPLLLDSDDRKEYTNLCLSSLLRASFSSYLLHLSHSLLLPPSFLHYTLIIITYDQLVDELDLTMILSPTQSVIFRDIAPEQISR